MVAYIYRYISNKSTSKNDERKHLLTDMLSVDTITSGSDCYSYHKKKKRVIML